MAGIPEPSSVSEKRHQTFGASTMAGAGKTGEDKKTRKWVIIGSVAGVIALVFIVMSYKKSAATTATTPATDTTGGYGYGGGGGDIASELQGINTQLGSISSQLNTPPATNSQGGPAMGPQPVPTNNYPVQSGAPTPARGSPPPSGGALPPISPSAFYALSHAAEAALVGSGQTLYQSGGEAIAWDRAHGINPAGINPNSYYGLSAPAARAFLASGQTGYQSGGEALAWARAHPGG